MRCTSNNSHRESASSDDDETESKRARTEEEKGEGTDREEYHFFPERHVASPECNYSMTCCSGANACNPEAGYRCHKHSTSTRAATGDLTYTCPTMETCVGLDANMNPVVTQWVCHICRAFRDGQKILIFKDSYVAAAHAGGHTHQKCAETGKRCDCCGGPDIHDDGQWNYCSLCNRCTRSTRYQHEMGKGHQKKVAQRSFGWKLRRPECFCPQIHSPQCLSRAEAGRTPEVNHTTAYTIPISHSFTVPPI
jgi:hypothetical protein